MKKISLIMAAALTVVSLTGCGKGATGKETSEKVEYEEETEISSVNENSTGTSADRNMVVDEASKNAKKYVTLANYKNVIEIPEDEKTVSDEAVDQSLDEYLNAYSEYYSEHVEGTVNEDSKVGIEYTLSDEISGTQGPQEQVVYIGMNEPFEGLGNMLIGKNTGEEFTMTFTYPDDWWNQEVIGKEATASVKILYLLGDPMYTEVTDEFVTAITDGQYNTVEEFREVQKNSLESYTKMNYGYSALMKVVEDSEYSSEIDNLIQNEKAQILADYASYPSMGNEQQPIYESFGFKSEEEYTNYINEMAESNVKQTLVVFALADELNIELSDKDIQEYAKQTGAQYEGDDYATDALVNDSYTRYILLSEKVTNALFELQ